MIARNAVDLVGFLITNLFTYISYWLYWDDPHANHDGNFTLRTLQWLFYGQGFLLVLPRLFEPTFFKIIWFKFRQVCCKTKKEYNVNSGLPEQDSENLVIVEEEVEEKCPLLEPMSMLINSTSNVEFVYLILEGIS